MRLYSKRSCPCKSLRSSAFMTFLKPDRLTWLDIHKGWSTYNKLYYWVQCSPFAVVTAVNSCGSSRTALVFVFTAVDAGRERVLAEVVAVRGRGGRRQLASVLLVRARRVLRRRRPRAASTRLALSWRGADLPHQLPDRVADRRPDRFPRGRRPPAAIREASLLILLPLLPVAPAWRCSVSIAASAISRRRVVRRRLHGTLVAAVSRPPRIIISRWASVSTVVPVVFGDYFLGMAFPFGSDRWPVIFFYWWFTERSVGF